MWPLGLVRKGVNDVIAAPVVSSDVGAHGSATVRAVGAGRVHSRGPPLRPLTPNPVIRYC